LSRIDPARVDELLDRAASARILVVGDLMLDRYVSGRVERVSPEAPVPVVLVDSERSGIGGAGNVAANVTALGAACAVIGCVGADRAGEELLSGLTALGVAAEAAVRVPSRPTTVKTRVHAGQHQIVRFDREVEHEVAPDVADALAASVRALVGVSDAVVVQDYDKGVMTHEVIRSVLDAAEAAEKPVVVDPKRRGFFEYGGATVFKPNRRELQDALGDHARPDDAEWMEETRKGLGCRHLLLTLGEGGMALQTEEGRLIRLPAVATGVFDVSGAGDTVSAALAVGLATGASVTEAASLANHAAAIGVGRPGVRSVSAADVRAHLVARAH
jgi:rfaE bifunctional protein kinase chain/domain